MNQEQPYVGIGHSPDGVDLPLGLGMQLMQEPKAMTAFGQLSTEQKASMIKDIQSAKSGQEAENKIMDVVASLRDFGASAFRL